jgi:hypothetical protein
MPWWMNLDHIAGFSKEERFAWRTIWIGVIVLFVPFYMPLVRAASALGLSKSSGALASLAIALPLATISSRRLCAMIWKETVKLADANAERRLSLARELALAGGRMKPPQSRFLTVVCVGAPIIGIPLWSFSGFMPQPYRWIANVSGYVLLFAMLGIVVICYRLREGRWPVRRIAKKVSRDDSPQDH